MVLPLTILLFAQWPLRDWLQQYSRQANDVAQIIFSLYAAVAITAASLSKSHLALTKIGNEKTPNGVAWGKWALGLCVVPWALFLIGTASPQMWVSVAQLESFSEGLTPGYFVLRIALVILALLVFIEATAHAFETLRGARNTNEPK